MDKRAIISNQIDLLKKNLLLIKKKNKRYEISKLLVDVAERLFDLVESREIKMVRSMSELKENLLSMPLGNSPLTTRTNSVQPSKLIKIVEYPKDELIKDNIKQLEIWSNSQFKQVILDSNHTTISAPVFYEAVKSRPSFFVLIKSGVNVFGSYHKTAPYQTGVISPEDPNHFVFSLKNEYNTPPVKYNRKKSGGVMRILRPEECGDSVFDIYGFGEFYKTNGTINSLFTSFYEDHNTSGGRLFTGKLKPETFVIDQFIVIQTDVL